MSATATTASSQMYEIHFNGDCPFNVENEIEDREVRIFHANGSSVYEYDHFYPGQDLYQIYDEETPLGVSCLFVKNNTYTFIGKEVFSFSLKENDTFVAFCAYLGPNDVPYSYLIGTQYVYLFTADRANLIAIPATTCFGDDLDYSIDPYEVLDEAIEDGAFVIPTATLHL